VQRDALIGQLHRIFEVEFLRPVDAVDRIPLHVLALLVQVHERGAAFVVFEVERGIELLRNRPVLVDFRHRIQLAERSHGALPPQVRPIIIFSEHCSHDQRDSNCRTWQGGNENCDAACPRAGNRQAYNRPPGCGKACSASSRVM
jgi:hypothetical protein